MSRRYCNLCYFGGIKLVWHLTELSVRETSETPLDVKLANRNEVFWGKRLEIGCGGGLQQACSSAIWFLVASNCSWHSCHIGYLWHLLAAVLLGYLSWPNSSTPHGPHQGECGYPYCSRAPCCPSAWNKHSMTLEHRLWTTIRCYLLCKAPCLGRFTCRHCLVRLCMTHVIRPMTSVSTITHGGPLLISHCFKSPKVRCTWCMGMSAPMFILLVVHSFLYPDSQEIASRGQATNFCELLWVVVAIPVVCSTKELNRKSEVLLVKTELYYTNHWKIPGLVSAFLVEDNVFTRLPPGRKRWDSSWSKMLPSIGSMISKSNAPKKIPATLPCVPLHWTLPYVQRHCFHLRSGSFNRRHL